MNKELEIYYEMEQCCSREWGDLDDLQLVEKSLKALEIIKKKVPLIYLLAGFVGKYDPEEIKLIKEVYIND